MRTGRHPPERETVAPPPMARQRSLPRSITTPLERPALRASAVSAIVCVLVAATAHASSRPLAAMWPVFDLRGWSMRSAKDGHITRFYVDRLKHWACWSGDLVDLRDIKQAPEDYWGPGGDVIGNQIVLRDPDGSWRIVGTYTESPNATEVWTFQIHRYPDKPLPYVLFPGHVVNSDTRTEYYGTFVRGKIVSSCLHTPPPPWGVHVYWRSQFRFDRGVLRAHYEENRCGATACQIENWTYTRGLGGVSSIEDVQAAGDPLGIRLRTVKRLAPTRRSLKR